MKKLDPFLFWSISSLLAAFVLLFDLSQPLGVAGGVPYVTLVLVGLFGERRRNVIVLAFAASLLTLLGYELSGPAAPLQVVVMNRALALFAIWSVAGAVALVLGQRDVLELQTRIDPLTNAYNRSFLMAALTEAIDRWQGTAQPLSLIMIDIDRFKSVNDRHGHQAGDRVLQAVARICQANVRGADRVCRFGGEEFAIVLPDANHGEAGLVAERIRRAVSLARFRLDHEALRVTVSLGVAEMREEYRGADDLVRAADRALYRCKHAGRNQVNIEPAGNLIPFRTTPA